MKREHVRVDTRPHGFSGERHFVLPADVRKRALSAPVTREILATAIGHFPHASGHLVQRREGVGDSILMLCVEGGGWCRFGGRHWRLRTGQVVVVPCGVPHAYGTTKERPWSIYWAHFNGRLVMDYLRMMAWSRSQPVSAVQNAGELSFHFESMLSLLATGYGPGNLAALSTAFAHVLALIGLNRVTGGEDARDSAAAVRDTIGFMRQSLARKLKLSDMARVAGLSVAHYSALFRRQHGYPPLAFFLRMKIQEAGQQLVTGSEPVNAIASRLGFDDAFYFSRMFKQITGEAPAHYRASHTARVN